MIVGIQKEIKHDENRVAMTPAGVDLLRRHGHDVLIETGAGIASGFTDIDYANADAQIVGNPNDIFNQAEMLLRVKEPQPSEIDLLRENQIYFAYLHLATSVQVTRALMDRGVVAIAYETVQTAEGSLPLLVPSSEVSGPHGHPGGCQVP